MFLIITFLKMSVLLILSLISCIIHNTYTGFMFDLPQNARIIKIIKAPQA